MESNNVSNYNWFQSINQIYPGNSAILNGDIIIFYFVLYINFTCLKCNCCCLRIQSVQEILGKNGKLSSPIGFPFTLLHLISYTVFVWWFSTLSSYKTKFIRNSKLHLYYSLHGVVYGFFLSTISNGMDSLLPTYIWKLLEGNRTTLESGNGRCTHFVAELIL